MKRGEVWQINLPPSSGHVQAGSRPALVIQNDGFTATLPTVLVVPFTGSTAATRFPGTVLVQPDGKNGLRVPSVALVFQLRAIDKDDLSRRLGVLDQSSLDQIAAVVDLLTSG